MPEHFDMRFDRVARHYDGVRAHPAPVSEQIGRAIAAIVGQRARVLELGVGTGRIALPVARADEDVIGVDIAREMLRVARGRGLDRLVRGDIVQLPFADHAFDAVLAVHVLHIPRDWREALVEAMRVLRPTGVFIMGRDWRSPESCAEQLRWKMREIAIELQPDLLPPGAGASIGRELGRLGGRPEPEFAAAEWVDSLSPAAALDAMAERNDPETWALDDELLGRILERLRLWAEATWGDLTVAQPVTRRFLLTVVRRAPSDSPPTSDIAAAAS
ncbi:MAG: class I SAM-dependent methyltransferase [Dehalococcoidia bacterium]|nr:class I SAM-dependent methyltransferase [Dehalococcoidia bacterium]